jgi:hypothetical protein
MGCAKDEKYEVLSATLETRKIETDQKDFTVFKLKHGRTIITASCQHYVGNSELECSALVVGNRYALERYRHNSLDMLALKEKKSAVVLDVEAESVQ